MYGALEVAVACVFLALFTREKTRRKRSLDQHTDLECIDERCAGIRRVNGISHEDDDEGDKRDDRRRDETKAHVAPARSQLAHQ